MVVVEERTSLVVQAAERRATATFAPEAVQSCAVGVQMPTDRSNGLDQQGIAAVKRWRFVPGRLHGRTVPVIVTIELSSRLQ